MEIYNGPWEYHLMSSPTISIFFWFFLWIFSLFFYLALPYKEMYNGPWKHHVTSSPTASIFFWFFRYIFDIFTFSTASLSIIGNSHWTLKTAHPTSSSTVSTIPYFFPLIFLYFIAIFHFEKRTFPYLEVRTGPWKHHPTSSPTIPIFFWLFPHFIVIFTFSTALPSIYGNVQWTLKTAPYPIFFLFFLLFYLFVNAISFMEMCTGPWNDEIAVREWSCYWNEKWNVLWQEWKRMKQMLWMNEN